MTELSDWVWIGIVSGVFGTLIGSALDWLGLVPNSELPRKSEDQPID